jgi:hypothetical protein
MLDNKHDEAFVLIEEDSVEDEAGKKLCARDNCRRAFTHQRITRKYCSDNCRKRDNEFTQNSRESRSKRRRNEEYYDRVKWAFHNLMQRPPAGRSD